MQLHPIFAAYVAHLERKGRDPKTVSRNRYALVRLNRWLDDLGVDPRTVTEVLLEEYVSWLASSFAAVTANREVAHIKAAFRYAVKLELIECTPAQDLEAPKVAHV